MFDFEPVDLESGKPELRIDMQLPGWKNPKKRYLVRDDGFAYREQHLFPDPWLDATAIVKAHAADEIDPLPPEPEEEEDEVDKWLNRKLGGLPG